MDYNQDCAFNRIHILDETIANSDKAGCAIFNGGINVNKNIYTKEINADYIQVKKIKVLDLCNLISNIIDKSPVIKFDKEKKYNDWEIINSRIIEDSISNLNNKSKNYNYNVLKKYLKK
jgi:hypothetical protein